MLGHIVCGACSDAQYVLLVARHGVFAILYMYILFANGEDSVETSL